MFLFRFKLIPPKAQRECFDAAAKYGQKMDTTELQITVSKYGNLGPYRSSLPFERTGREELIDLDLGRVTVRVIDIFGESWSFSIDGEILTKPDDRGVYLYANAHNRPDRQYQTADRILDGMMIEAAKKQFLVIKLPEHSRSTYIPWHQITRVEVQRMSYMVKVLALKQQIGCQGGGPR